MHKRIFALICTLIIAFSLCSCVDQHAGKKEDSGENKKVIATSPATVQICNKLNIKLIAVPESDFTMADEYKDLQGLEVLCHLISRRLSHLIQIVFFLQ